MLLLIMMIVDDYDGDGDDGDNHDDDHLSLVGLPGHHDCVPSRLRPHKPRRVELLDVRLRYHHLGYHQHRHRVHHRRYHHHAPLG